MLPQPQIPGRCTKSSIPSLYCTPRCRSVAVAQINALQRRFGTRRSRCHDIRVLAASDPQPSSKSCVLIECDGGLLDVHTEGHRVAFNRAFEELGYGCANWHPAIYYDLLRMGDATGPGLVKTYYDIERSTFVEKVYTIKQRIFKQMVDKGEIPLRTGVTEFVDEILNDGVRPVILAGTASSPEDSVVSCAMLGLGPTRAFQMQVLYLGSPSEVNSQVSKDTDDDLGDEDPALTLDQRISQAQAQAKKVAAASFTRAVNLQTTWGAGMRVDPSLIAGKERSILASPSFMAAVLTAMECSGADSVMVAASHTLMEAAKGVGMLVAGVPPSLAARGGYSAMDAGFDGFGAGGGLTWRKAKAMLEARKNK